MPLTDALHLTTDGDTTLGEVTPEWAQGRAAFGGLLAGMAIRAVSPRIPSDRRLRSALISFVGPAAVGPIRIDTHLHRAGRAVTHAEARLSQDGEVRAVVLLAYGADRETAVRSPASPAPSAPPPESLPPFPYIEGVTPTFTRQFQYRWTDGDFPFSGGASARFGGWVRLAEPVPVDDAVILALLDAWPAPVLALMRAPAPASTVTWMVDLVAPPDVAPDAWFRFAADTVAAEQGHASVEARLWGPDGALIGVSRQLVAEFSKA